MRGRGVILIGVDILDLRVPLKGTVDGNKRAEGMGTSRKTAFVSLVNDGIRQIKHCTILCKSEFKVQRHKAT